MTTWRETDHDTARYSQGAFTYPLEIWADWVQKFVDPEPYLRARRHRAEEVVDEYFHVLERILAIQREAVKRVVASYTWTATKAASTVHDVAKEVHDVAKEVHDVAREAPPKRDMHDGARESTLKKS
ncbi:MAG: hypothetical protein JO364_10195 [Pseudonocardiales bacterium]|nr:hypothetical protein [Pseudonocardiales bacterium]